MINPNTITLEPETISYFEEIDESLERLNKHRPFSPEINQKIKTAFLPDRVTGSLNIEGITITRRQTLAMMDAMTLNENTSKAELEILNALKADEFVYDYSQSERDFSSSFIREVNSVIQNQVDPNPGAFRTSNVEITGAAFQPPSHNDVPILIRELVETFNSRTEAHPILKAAWLHATFTHIHPFADGNGRTGRLLQDYALLRGKYFPTGIPSSKRDDYYDALEAADNNTWDSLCQMIAETELSVISKIQAIVDEDQNRGKFIAALAKRASQKKSGALHKQYLVWRQRMQNFIDQTVETCDGLSKESDIINIRSDKMEIVDFSKWKEISDSGRSANTWALKQAWFLEGAPFYRTIFFFKRHEFRPEDTLPKDDLHGVVSLMITGLPANTDDRYNFDNFSDNEISFRELCFVGSDNCVYRGTNKWRESKFKRQEIWECSSSTNSSDIIEQLMEDIFGKKLGI